MRILKSEGPFQYRALPFSQNASGCPKARHRDNWSFNPISGKTQVLIEDTKLRRGKKGTGESNPSRLRSSPEATSNLVPPTVHL